MNHRKFGKKLGRTHNQRQALFRSQIRSVFTYGLIKTTDAKVKAVRPAVEKLAHAMIVKPDLISRRLLSRFIQDRDVVKKIVDGFKATFVGQTSNFTLTKNIKFRQGDNSLVVKLYLTKPFTIVTPPAKKEVKDKKEKVDKKVVKKLAKVAKKETK